jgi:hypothetical protein
MRPTYYSLTRVEDLSLGVAYAPEGYSHDMIAEGRYYDHWKPVDFTIKPWRDNHGGFADYQTNNMGWPLCSDELRQIIDRNRSPRDEVQWLEATVTHEGQSRRYWVLHIPDRPDVLDSEKTIFAYQGFVVKPVFRMSELRDRNVFSYVGGNFTVLVSSQVRTAMVAANCTGIDFLRIPLSDR